MKTPRVWVIDFETEAIEHRPKYPPEPVGVSIIEPGKSKGKYYAFDHENGLNNCTRQSVTDRLTDIVRSGTPMLFQNAKFDVAVMVERLGVPMPDWRQIHDTMYLLFLYDPHAKSLSLKPSAERILGEPPTEQDEVRDWVLQHKGVIEQTHGKFTPKQWGMHIARAPAGLAGKYANGDTGRTLRLFKHLWGYANDNGLLASYDRERQLMPIMLRNEAEGIRIDMSRLEQDIAVYQKDIVVAEDWLREVLRVPGLDFNKRAAVAHALDTSGVVTDWVLTPTGKKSTKKEYLTVDRFNSPEVFQALSYRNRLQTCLGTFLENWQEAASRNNGWLNTDWNQVRHHGGEGGSMGARTGRMSCHPNFMNIPTAWEGKGDGYAHPEFLGVQALPVIRGYVLPDKKSHMFAGRDYSQQELRILAHFEDGKLLKAYQENPALDVHDFVGDQIAGLVGVRLPRKAVKILNFGLIYGMGAAKLGDSMGIAKDQALKVRKALRSAFPGIKKLEDEIRASAKMDDCIVTWGGREYYKEPDKLVNGRRMSFEYKLLNYLIQGSAADCTKQAIINYDAVKDKGRFLVQVHDEINISVPKGAAKKELAILRDAMADVNFDVPMLSDAKMGPSWGEAKELG